MFVAVNFVFCLLFTVVVSITFEQQALEAHNKKRALHGSPPMVLNKALSAFAKKWAENLAAKNIFEHRPNNKYGENLYMSTGVVNGQKAVDAWYNEIKDYKYSKPGFSMKTGHFTQVVWKQSRQLGIGVAKKNGWTYVVANYDPPGNYQGRFPANVPPKKK